MKRRAIASTVASIAVAAAVAAAILAARAPLGGASLPFYGTSDFTPNWRSTSHRVGEFSLVDQRGVAFTDKDLAGKVYVASFIYTRCSGICPALVGNLKHVQAAIEDPNLLIVSFSVTPELDTPAVLSAFGAERGIDPARWKLVTGDKAQIYSLARVAYFADDERLRGTLGEPGAFLHTEKLVLVDQEGRLRGLYDGTLPRDVELLVADATALVVLPRSARVSGSAAHE